MITREKVREALTGPIAPVFTPFTKSGEIDFDSLRNFLDFVIAGGSKSVILTFGDSLYSVLTDTEVAEVTKVIVEHVAGRAMVVAADRVWWIGKTVEFAKYVRDLGADMLMVLPPDWGASCTPRTFADHYAAVAEHIPVMVVTNVFIPRGIAVGLETLKILLDEVDGIYAIKDDMCGEFARKMALMVHDHWAVLSGGMKQNHLNTLPYGCDGYLSLFIAFKPGIAMDYWRAIKSQDLDKAREVIKNYDMPLFDYLGSLQGGFDAGIYATLELFGITKRWRRKPYYSLNDEEVEKLAEFLRNLCLL